MVQLSIGDEWYLPTVTANDNVDGNITSMIETDFSEISAYLVSGSLYQFTQVGNYEITYLVSDQAGNIETFILSIQVTIPSVDWSGYSNYYTSLTSSSDIITDLAYLLRNSIDYVSYGDARYVYTVYENQNQVILYDIPSSSSYAKVTSSGFDGWGTGGYIVGDGYSITVNREHVWACNDMRIMPNNKDRTLSEGYVPFILNDGTFVYTPDNTSLGHFSDLHNLWIAIESVNASHSDHFFGEENGSSIAPYLMNQIFYPGDEYKGDLARILFYMTLMYPHLTLVSETDENAVEGSIYYGFLDVLLRWNEEDPVSYYEVTRNETIFNQQGNRNPFIDFYSDNIIEIIFLNGDPNVLD